MDVDLVPFRRFKRSPTGPGLGYSATAADSPPAQVRGVTGRFWALGLKLLLGSRV